MSRPLHFRSDHAPRPLGLGRSSIAPLILTLLFASASTACPAAGGQGTTTPNQTFAQEAGTNPIDRNGDGLVDNDNQAFGSLSSQPSSSSPNHGEPEDCSDDIDNDGDMDIDCDDSECAMLPACQ